MAPPSEFKVRRRRTGCKGLFFFVEYCHILVYDKRKGLEGEFDMQQIQEKIFLNNLLAFEIPEISSETNFWMVRTKQGYFFEEFIREEFIALGWNIITKNTDFSENNNETLKETIKSMYGDKVPQLAINKCRNFIDKVKENDIIVIPNAGSKRIAFARVGEYYEEDIEDVKEIEIVKKIENKEVQILDVQCPYKKRRKIKILRIVDANRINYHLFRAITNYHGISNLDDYGKMILDSIYPIYCYEGLCSFQVLVNTTKEIKTKHLLKLINGMNKCIIMLTKSDDISSTINLNSPGNISMWFEKFKKCSSEDSERESKLEQEQEQRKSIPQKAFDILKSGKTISTLLVLLFLVTGGELEVAGVKISSPGIAEVIKDLKTIDYVVEKEELEIESQKMSNFQIKYDFYKKIKEDNINVNDILTEMEEISKAGKALEVGFDNIVDAN